MNAHRAMILVLALCSCNASSLQSGSSSVATEICKGIYYTRDTQGELKKWNEYLLNSRCLTDNVALTRFESSSEAWRRQSYSCNPVTNFSSRTLVAANNFYNYRDGKLYLDLDANSGKFRRVVLAEGRDDGKPSVGRLQGCFYVRGNQILLDTSRVISTQYFDPMEIFEFTETASTMEMVRFDDSADWDYRFCPYLDVPWGFCNLLRDGNELHWPSLNSSQKSSLLSEAFLIRKQFNFQDTSRETFNNLWNNTGNRIERVREDYKYAVQAIVDTPIYIDQAWAQYVRGERPAMPDTLSTRIPYLCYEAWRRITPNDGSSSRIHGEACYSNGQYTFTQF